MRDPLLPATELQLKAAIDRVFERHGEGRGRFCLVVDADRTLARPDTGRLVGRALGVDGLIRDTFDRLGYADEAFTVVASHWANLPADAYLACVHQVAASVSPHAAWLETFAAVADTVPVVVVTAGIPQAWRAVLDRHGFDCIAVVGGCHPRLDAFTVTPNVKALLVRLAQRRGWRVVSAGDSPIDVPMLQAADMALAVADHKGSPGLVARFPEIPGIRQFDVVGVKLELEQVRAADLVMLLQGTGGQDAHRPNARTAHATARRRNPTR